MDREGECSPLNTLAEVFAFQQHLPTWGRLTSPRSRRSSGFRNDFRLVDGHACHVPVVHNFVSSPMESNLPRTLVCHDMKNGYLDDRHVNGSDDHSAYLFYHWAAVDIFVYFSHHFVTIPPLGWINAAHKHGVQILGTIITEWNEGFKICEEFLESRETLQNFANQLVAIAKYFKLDGWLLNVENKIKEVQNLIEFVKYLTDEMHRSIPDSVVIWYDSVTNAGDLQWQNCVNERNECFFDVCDGIFTNYCWGITHLERSLSTAGNRKHDVFIGIDVWGRNFWGGGCFNTIEAVKEIHMFDFSMAIFAPAWTHEGMERYEIARHSRTDKAISETCNSDGDSTRFSSIDMECATKHYFLLRENAFWNVLWPYLNTKGPTILPFHSFFCLGSGDSKRVNGKIISDKPWFNLREQQYQLSIPQCSINFVLEDYLPKLDNVGRKRLKRDDENTSSELNCGCDESELTSSSSSDDQKAEAPIENDQNTEAPIENDQNTEAPIEVEAIEKKEASTLESSRKRKPAAKKLYVKSNDEESGCISYYTKDSFYGGNCLKICPLKIKDCDVNSIEPRTMTRLFTCDFNCHYNFVIYYIIKNLHDKNQDLNLILSMRDNRNNRLHKVILCGPDFPTVDNNTDCTVQRPVINNEFYRLRENLQSYYPSFYISTDSENWKVRYYIVKFPKNTITDIGCELTKPTNPLLLGGLGITKDIPPFN